MGGASGQVLDFKRMRGHWASQVRDGDTVTCGRQNQCEWSHLREHGQLLVSVWFGKKKSSPESAVSEAVRLDRAGVRGGGWPREVELVFEAVLAPPFPVTFIPPSPVR